MVTNCFVSDGEYFYDSVDNDCYNSPMTACDNPKHVDVTNGNAIIGRCWDFKVSNTMNLAPNEIGFVIENYEPKKSSYLIIAGVLLIIILAVLFRPKNLF